MTMKMKIFMRWALDGVVLQWGSVYRERGDVCSENSGVDWEQGPQLPGY